MNDLLLANVNISNKQRNVIKNSVSLGPLAPSLLPLGGICEIAKVQGCENESEGAIVKSFLSHFCICILSFAVASSHYRFFVFATSHFCICTLPSESIIKLLCVWNWDHENVPERPLGFSPYFGELFIMVFTVK